MFGLFRKRIKLTVDEAAMALLGLIEGLDDPDADQCLHTLDEAPLDSEMLRGELTYLRVFSIEYGAWLALKQGTVRESLITAFRSQLRGAIERAVPGSTMLQDTKSRLDAYWSAANTPHQKGPAWNVGKVFSQYCGEQHDAMLVLQAGVRFTGTVKAVSEFVRSMRIT
jgi:hypothetical protein